MIPVARTTRPEYAANQLLLRYGHVLVAAHYDNLDSARIRFRADLVRDNRVFFAKVPSQIKRWRERGGLLISWRRVDSREGPHDAIVFMECPKSIEGIYAASYLTRYMAVVYSPPTWRMHEDTIIRRHKAAHPSKFARQMKRLEIVRDYVNSLPLLTTAFIARRQSSPAGPLQLSSSFSPAPLAGAAHSPGTTG